MLTFLLQFVTVLINPSPCFLQYDGVPKLISRSTTSLKFFLRSLNQRSELGLSSSTSIPSTGIVTDLNPLRWLSSTRRALVSVSPSISMFIWILFTVNLLVYFSEMEDVKRRAAIRVQAAKRKETNEGAMGTGSSKPSVKKRPLPKGDRAPKKQKVSTEPVLGLMAEGTKTVTPAKHGGGKGLMVPPPGSQKKPPVLLCEDPKYALEKLSSIIGNEDYEDLGNHSTEAMGEMSLFSIAQVRVRHNLAHGHSLFESNSLLSSGNAHDEGVDGTVFPSRADAWTGP